MLLSFCLQLLFKVHLNSYELFFHMCFQNEAPHDLQMTVWSDYSFETVQEQREYKGWA